MQIAHDPSWTLTLPDEDDPRQARRSQGLHLSTILSDLNIRLYKPEYGTAISPMYARRGFMFERMLSRAFAEEVCPPTRLNQIELVSDGIFMTPDSWVVDWKILDEYKATETTMKKMDPGLHPQELAQSFIKHHRAWAWQIMSYLRRLGMDTCHLYVWFLRGNYRFDGPRGVDTIPRYVLRFDQDEIEQNWQMVLNHRETMMKEGKI